MTSIVIDVLGEAAFGSALEMTTIGEARVVWQFGDFEPEYAVLRTGAGLIDVSAGGPIRVSGPSAVDVLQAALTRDVEFLIPDRAQWSMILEPLGKVIDVVTVVAGDSDYLVLTGPGQASRVEDALRSAAEGFDAAIDNLEATTAVFAVEGPRSWSAVARVLGADYVSLAYESALPVEIDGVEALIARLGVTGEYGYTFVAPVAVAGALWQQLAANGATPVGHRARETAMFEIRQPVVHRELRDEDTVLTAGLNWLVDFSKEEFVGRDTMLVETSLIAPLRPVGFVVETGSISIGDPLYVGTEVVGEVAYIVSSPGLHADLGLAKVAPEWQASRLEFTSGDGSQVRTLAPPYVVPKSWSTAIEV